MHIPNDIFNLYYETVDDMTTSNFGVPCTLNYPEQRVICTNCVFDSLNQVSSNVYNGTGPISFTSGLCPYCNGIGFTSSVVTESVYLRVYFDKKSFAKLSVPINIADGSVVTIGRMEDLPKILRCSSVVFNTNISGNIEYQYALTGEPILHGLRKSRFFIAIWHRV